MDIKAQQPYRVERDTYVSRYYADNYVIRRESDNDASYTISEGDFSSDGDSEFSDSELYEPRTYEGVTMFVVFDYETKELIRNDRNDEVMFYSSVRNAYEDQDTDESEFNSRFCIFKVPELKKYEVKPSSSRSKSFSTALKSVAVSEDLDALPVSKWSVVNKQ